MTVPVTGLVVALVVSGVIVSVACSGSDELPSSTVPSSSVAATVTTVPTTPDGSDAYFAALVDPTVDPSTVAVGPAALYLDHRRLSAAVLTRSTTVVPGTTSTSRRVCTEATCVTVDVERTDPATGLVDDVSVDGRPVGGRITGNGPLAAVDGVGARLRTAYLNADGHLLVTVEVDNSTGVDVEVFPFAAVLRPGGTGAGVEASGAFGAAQVPPGSSSVVLLDFDVAGAGDARLVGRIGLRGILADGLDVALDIEIPAPAA